ncbi:MAG: PLP-dependent aminotransferase family protein [Chloroflexota bacterium]
MSKIVNHFHFSGLDLKKNHPTPLHRQLYEYIRLRILQGQIKPDTRLPPTRTLAKDLKISRNTVLNAYKQLIAEGYLETHMGADTRVTHNLPDSNLQVGKPTLNQKTSAADERKLTHVNLSDQGKLIVELPYPYWDRTGSRPFTSSQPGVDAFPNKVWEKTLTASWRNLKSEELCYPSPLGHRPLRETLATYLQTSRGLNCSPEQVIITNGTQQALTVATTLLLNKGDTVWVENPSYNGVKIALQLRQAKLIPVEVDKEGLNFDLGLEKAPQARMVCISPSHQYPLGVTMSLTRRLALLRWAAENDVWIIEDDYDSEIRYAGYPMESLQGLDEAGRVIYMGTYSKVLFPSLRIGYMVVPKSLIEPLRAARAYFDRGNSILEQEAVHQFIQNGHLERHLRRMRTLYEVRQTRLVDMAHHYCRGLLDVEPSNAGLHLVGWLPDGNNDQLVSKALMNGDIYAPPLTYFASEPLNRAGLVLGYATVPEDQIETAVKKMAQLLNQALAK